MRADQSEFFAVSEEQAAGLPIAGDFLIADGFDCPEPLVEC